MAESTMKGQNIKPLSSACGKSVNNDIDSPNQTFGIVGFRQLKVPCIIGIYPEERQSELLLLIDFKLEIELSRCLQTCNIEDTVNYVYIAQFCTEFAQKNCYFLIESLAADILDECFRRYNARWAWVSVQKPSALPQAAFGFIEMERCNPNFRNTL